jgi:hypothetical protein
MTTDLLDISRGISSPFILLFNNSTWQASKTGAIFDIAQAYRSGCGRHLECASIIDGKSIWETPVLAL